MSEVIGVSGGPDSYIAYLILVSRGHDVKPVKVLLGHKYEKDELKACSELYEKYEVCSDFQSYSIHNEKPDGEIPFRNALIALALSKYSDVIWIAIQRGETANPSNDRSPESFKLISEFISFFVGRNVRVDSPIWDMTKQDLYEWYVKNGYDITLLKKSWSCIRSRAVHCGSCPACFRRAVAEQWVGIFDRNDYMNDPRVWSGIETYLKKMKQGLYEERRTVQTLKVLSEWGYV